MAWDNVSEHMAQAIAHPLRIALLVALRDGPRSTQSLAKELGAAPHDVRRHARVLESLGYVSERERFYELVAPPRYSDEAWARLPVHARRAALAPGIVAIQSLMSRAMDRGGFDRDDIHLTRTDLRLDRAGWDAVAGQLNALLETLPAVLDGDYDGGHHAGEETVAAHVVLMLFASDDTAAEPPAPTASGDPLLAEDESIAQALDVSETIEELLAAREIDWDAVVQHADQLRLLASTAARAQATTPVHEAAVVPLRPRK